MDKKIPVVGDRIIVHDSGGHITGEYSKKNVATIIKKNNESDFTTQFKGGQETIRLLPDDLHSEQYHYENKWEYVNTDDYELTF